MFIDADKPNYVDYYDAVAAEARRRGLIAADNTLWSGNVAGDEDQSDAAVALREFNDRVRDDDRVVCVMLSVRDGITLIRRRG